jgi:hypothetical protein
MTKLHNIKRFMAASYPFNIGCSKGKQLLFGRKKQSRYLYTTNEHDEETYQEVQKTFRQTGRLVLFVCINISKSLPIPGGFFLFNHHQTP